MITVTDLFAGNARGLAALESPTTDVMVRSAVVDFDAELPECSGDVSGPVLEALDRAKQFDRGFVERHCLVFGVDEGRAARVRRADAEFLTGGEYGLLEGEEESRIDGGHGVTVVVPLIRGDALFGGA